MGQRNISNFTENRYRKAIHFSLILCLLIIQLLIGGYFYNEFASKEKLAAIERKITALNVLEQLTEDAKTNLAAAQGHLQNYVMTKDKAELRNYFSALNAIANNLSKLENKNGTTIRVDAGKISLDGAKPAEKLKKILDSTFTSRINQNPPQPAKVEFPQFQKFETPDLNFDNYNIETKVYSDTVKRKKRGLFGRISDAIAGKETTKKDSTVIIMKPGSKPNSEKLKSRFDSIINAADRHYTKEITKIEHTVVQQKAAVKDDSGFYKVFGSLILYSNRLIGVYGSAVRNSKSDLTAEYNLQNSKSTKIRKNLVLAAIFLMFIVSILILMLTRLAFRYEQKLNSANRMIRENLNFKNRILGMLSHELRAPLKIVDIFIKRINRKTDNPEIKEYLKSISFTNNSLLMQAEQILEYTKNQYIENKLVPANFNLNDEVENILAAIKPYVEARNNSFLIEKNISPALEVFSDNAKIHQLYLNIIGNANKFTENGNITVKAEARETSSQIIEFTTTVQDTGAGIRQSDLDKIFEPYYQGVLSGDVENIGAGLGLSLCKEIIDLFSGTISVTSEPAKGTTVNFTILLNKQNA